MTRVRRLVLLSLLLVALGLHAQDAARVAMVRNATALVRTLRAQLGRESNAEAARELVGAVTLLGSDEDIEFAASQLARFPASIDESAVAAPASVPSSLREVATVPRAGASVEERLGRELLRRTGGAAPVEDAAFLEWLKKHSMHRSLDPLLTKKEQKADWPYPKTPPSNAVAIDTPPFLSPLVLPRGRGAAIFAARGAKAAGSAWPASPPTPAAACRAST
jgi:hypothetical protein